MPHCVAVLASRLAISSRAVSHHHSLPLRAAAASFSLCRSSHTATASSLSSVRSRASRSLSTAASVDTRVSSTGSHSDFAGRSNASPAAASSSASALIASDVSSHPVFLYMKGSPSSPKCGFSANVVRILQHLGAPFSSRDVLEDASVREAVKAFSDWPTLPQLYVKGEFVGGSDIISQMFKSGELEKLLAQAGVVQPQQTQAAAAAAPESGEAASSKLAQ